MFIENKLKNEFVDTKSTHSYYGTTINTDDDVMAVLRCEDVMAVTMLQLHWGIRLICSNLLQSLSLYIASEENLSQNFIWNTNKTSPFHEVFWKGNELFFLFLSLQFYREIVLVNMTLSLPK